MWYTVCIKFSNTVYVSMQEVRHMFMEERHREISEALQANGKITIAEIAGKYGISDESARRDLRLLEQKGICRRTHGGALALGQVGIRPPADRDFDNMPIFENYREIARTAVQKIKETIPYI